MGTRTLNRCGRAFLAGVVAVASATAIAIAPSVSAPPRPVPVVQLAGAAQPLIDSPTLLAALSTPGVPQVVTAAPAVVAAVTGPVLTGIGQGILAVYNAVLPWVDYGVELASYVVGWIPVVGIFAPQINIVYFSFIRPVANSVVNNLAGVLEGTIGIGSALGNVGTDTVNALVGLGVAEVNWLLSFLPPLPPLPFAAAKQTITPAASTVTKPAVEKITVTSGPAKPSPAAVVPVPTQHGVAKTAVLHEATSAGPGRSVTHPARPHKPANAGGAASTGRH